MKCPNCSHEADDGTAECPACQLIFAKWKAAAERPRAVPKASSGGGLGKWIGLIVLAVCAWGFTQFSGEPADASEKVSGAVTAKEAQTGTVGTFKPPSDHCGYEGRVMDVARQTPIPGAKVYLDAYVATSDASGRYRMIVRAMRGGCEPFPSVRHSNYQKNYWTRHFEDIEPEERLAMQLESVPPARVKGSPGKSTTLNFSLFPIELPVSLLNAIAANAEDTVVEETPDDTSSDSQDDATE